METVKRGATEYSIEEILSLIRENGLKAHDKLPSERSLCDMFGVSRSSVRRAIEHLEGEQVIYSVPNRGMFVKEKKIQINLSDFTSFQKQMEMKNLPYVTHTIKSSIQSATSLIADSLDISIGDEVFELIRHRIINGESFSLQKSYISMALFPEINTYDYSSNSLYKVLEDKYKTIVCKGKESIYLTNPTEFESEIMDVDNEELVICSEGINYDVEDNPIEFIKQITISNNIGYYSESYCKEDYENE